jgi:hypothetical protein
MRQVARLGGVGARALRTAAGESRPLAQRDRGAPHRVEVDAVEAVSPKSP